jgi:hypothetical protein
MRDKRVTSTNMVAEQLFAAEQAIDAAIAATAKLSALMPEARTLANLSAVVGQAALGHAGDTLMSLIAARNEIVLTHHALDEVKTDIGLRTLAMGGAVRKPFDARHLDLVQAEAA